MKFLSALLVTAAMVICIENVPFAEEWSAAQKEVWNMQEAFFEKYGQGDKEGVLAFYHPNCSLWPTLDLSPSGKTSITFYRIRSAKHKPMAINLFGNVAIVHYFTSFKHAGQDYLGRNTTIWMKENEIIRNKT